MNSAQTKNIANSHPREGKIKYALVGMMLGLPLPIILILLFVRGCDF